MCCTWNISRHSIILHAFICPKPYLSWTSFDIRNKIYPLKINTSLLSKSNTSGKTITCNLSSFVLSYSLLNYVIEYDLAIYSSSLIEYSILYTYPSLIQMTRHENLTDSLNYFKFNYNRTKFLICLLIYNFFCKHCFSFFSIVNFLRS